MAVKKYEVTGKPPAGVTGKPGVAVTSGVDLMTSGREFIDDGGTQSGSHPAKTQPNRIKYFEK